MTRGRVVAIVPAHDEQSRVGATVRALRSYCDLVVVVDDASTDATADAASEAGARVVRLRRNRGKGGALTAGMSAAGDAAVVLFADADLAESASALEPLIDAVAEGRADVAVAAPPPGAKSGVGAVESFARLAIKIGCRREMRRPLSGQRALRGDVAHRLRLAPRFAVETAMTIDAVRAGYRLVEIPIEFTHAKTGRDAAGFAHRARQGIDIVAAVVPRLLRRRSRRGIVQP